MPRTSGNGTRRFLRQRERGSIPEVTYRKTTTLAIVATVQNDIVAEKVAPTRILCIEHS